MATKEPFSQSKSQAFDKNHLRHPYSPPPSPTNRENLLVKAASGVHLTLADDTKVIDAMSSWWCAIHGYNNAHINASVSEQLTDMAHVMFGGITHQPAIELGKKLLDIAPSTLTNIFYSDSGSVAVEVAMKMAVQYQYALGNSDKCKFLSIRSGEHGDTWKAMSVSDPSTGMHHLFSGALQAEHFAPRPPIQLQQEWLQDPSKNGLQEVAQTLEAHGKHIAAMILEPLVQGAGGMYFYHPNYLNECRKLCDDHNVLLIFDEIATGFGRTGKLFATNHCQVQPDIMCLGKAITGGYLSFAATLCSHKVTHSIASGEPGLFMHGPTFMANPLACSAAIASLELLESNPWQQWVARIELQLKSELGKARGLKGVADVRVLGAIGVIEMDHPVDASLAQALCAELGVWLRPFGHNIYCMPPYIITSEELSKVTRAMIQLTKK